MKEYKVIGLMSGSSLDGLDMAYCHFYFDKNQWNYQIEKAITLPYSAEWKNILYSIRDFHAEQILDYHQQYGKLLGNKVADFVSEHKLSPDLIASHGHTVFHNPMKGYTFQLGSGQAIATVSRIKTVSDFRSKDVCLGGQGAPLVPIGDELLFHTYDYCLNLGGIANISYSENGIRKGFDVCPANQLLNYLSRQLGESFDENGHFAQLGKLHKPLFDALNSGSFYSLPLPKSLSNEYVEEHFFSLIDAFDISIEDKLYTTVKHIAFQINRVLTENRRKQILTTGGGANNNFLIKALQLEKGQLFIIPEKRLVDFKEALIFALMGVLRQLRKTNCLASSTGALKDSSAGNIYLP